MTILLDSSALIHAQRQPNSEITGQIVALLASGEAAVTGPVIMEYLQGARTQDEMGFLVRRVLALNFLEMDQAVWVIAGQLGNRFNRSGEPIAMADLSIAATAIRHRVPLFTLDRDFDGIPELELYQPPQGPESHD